jgi:hypothetical protein
MDLALIIINTIVERYQSVTLRLSNILLRRRVPEPLAGETLHSTPVGTAYSAENAPVLRRPGLLSLASWKKRWISGVQFP